MKHTLKNLTLVASALALGFSSTACAQQQKPTPVAPTQVAVEQVELDGPALWKVADEDTTIYLFGTVHALPKDVDWYKSSIADALSSSDKLVTEIYMKPGTEAQAQAAFMTEGMLPEGQNLRDLLNEEQKASYEAAMTKLGMPAAAFDRFEPWLAGINLSMLPLFKAGYTPDAGVEKVLEKKAGETPRGALETVDFQVGVFDGLPMDSQIKFMMEAANGIDEIVPMLDSMVDEWVEGDAAGLASLMNGGLTDPALAEALLYARNRTWAEWIDTRLDTPGTVFVAVGAGHLAGEQSVQDALATRGITSTRVQ
ncbi:TraB/GumN family protein [Pontixanthobacter sp. CEM42]|uniref:TraB/GumN family protein n=1 Tax=Pontixanthobacter sp. CEM42 TaxID=2792077 RepID=UPI001AE03D6B|nr:TraB/GumN family protein [Pontixanthobacter sp. CEM42]